MNKYIRQTGWQDPGAEKAECAPGSLVGQSRSKAHLVLGVLPTDLRPLNSFQTDQHCCGLGSGFALDHPKDLFLLQGWKRSFGERVQKREVLEVEA